MTKIHITEFIHNNPVIETVACEYGLTSIETTMLLVLNDFFEFTFEEFAYVIKILPKSYSVTPTIRRLEESLVWLHTVHGMRPPNYIHKYINYRGIPDRSEWTPCFLGAIYNTKQVLTSMS
jgi:hypothetical protein